MAMSVFSQKPNAAIKDLEYFMTSEFVVFQVEGVLFRVPTYAFVSESNVFSTMFKLPQGNKTNEEGTSADKPIKLPADIKSKDFKGLLKLLYPLKPLANSTKPMQGLMRDEWICTMLGMTREEWVSTLKLATKWEFLNARKIALQALQKTKGSATEKITLGRELKISKWVLEGYKDLTNIDDTATITDGAASTVGWEATVKLLQIREERLRKRNSKTGFNTPIPGSPSAPSTPIFNFSLSKVEKTVEDAFKEELLQIRSEELQYSNAFEKA